MNSYIYRVAKAFFEQYGPEISTLTFVFPNRRAGVFFQRYLSDIAKKAIFSPEILTIDECFTASSKLLAADKLNLLFKIFNIYKKLSGTDESFDTFIFWGEVLLSDFNEADKYLVDAKQLFSNITELKEIDSDYEFITENQKEAILKFWSGFDLYKNSETRSKFLKTWQLLYPIYDALRNDLLKENSAYEGMLFRQVVEDLGDTNLPEWFDKRKFVFTGFNALNPCESKLMSALKKHGKADFYWDYESDILRDKTNPASGFYFENIHKFPSALKVPVVIQSIDETSFNHYSVASVVGQTKQIYRILENSYNREKTKNFLLKTAIILPDEKLLVPLLNAIPWSVDKINVTMGYPLRITPIAGLMEHIFELHKRKKAHHSENRFYHKTVLNILNHQLIIRLCGFDAKEIYHEITSHNLIYIDGQLFERNRILATIFNPGINATSFLSYLQNLLTLLDRSIKISSEKGNNYELESNFIFQYYLTINRLSEIIIQYENIISMNIETQIKLIYEISSGINVPFVGEPLNGLQIMGVLEARGLDFENIIIPSFNEGVFPAKTIINSFVPYQLRRGFGMPTYDHHDRISSYNFYRLIQRARNVTFLSDTRMEKGNTGEVSRYYQQLKYHYNVDIKEHMTVYDISFENSEAISVRKDEHILQKLNKFLNKDNQKKALSASSINTYINCPLKFYFSHIEDVEQLDEITENVENNTFGNIFHQVMEEIYLPFTGKLISDNEIDKLINDKNHINELITDAFRMHFFKLPKGRSIILEGNNLLISNILHKYIKQVLITDKSYAPFKYIGGEKLYYASLRTNNGFVNLKGYIDRIDEREGKVRILDYKTGKGELSFNNWDDVFDHNYSGKSRPGYVLQTFLYSYLFKQKFAGAIITPGIYYLRNIFNENFSTEISYQPEKTNKMKIENYEEHEDEFLSRLTNTLEEIFEVETPFYQTKNVEICQHCDYKTICKR